VVGGSMDLIVPIRCTRQAGAGTRLQQAALLGASRRRTLAVPSQEKALLPLRAQPRRQVGLSTAAAAQPFDRFCCPRPDLVSRRHVLLIDDVMITGATIPVPQCAPGCRRCPRFCALRCSDDHDLGMRIRAGTRGNSSEQPGDRRSAMHARRPSRLSHQILPGGAGRART